MIDTTKVYRPDDASSAQIKVTYGTEPNSPIQLDFWNKYGDTSRVLLGPLELSALINMLTDAHKTIV
ncbi:hypothetical protein ACH427_03315 [Streptomyces sp. NPDC020379]|uniref:hypothetical protein n=1 Tax=Streptomyces sp. NPDC020379 TaxID=3365071 RepID=UPI003799FFB0